jgi:hypothetical protein
MRGSHGYYTDPVRLYKALFHKSVTRMQRRNSESPRLERRRLTTERHLDKNTI